MPGWSSEEALPECGSFLPEIIVHYAPEFTDTLENETAKHFEQDLLNLTCGAVGAMQSGSWVPLGLCLHTELQMILCRVSFFDAPGHIRKRFYPSVRPSVPAIRYQAPLITAEIL